MPLSSVFLPGESHGQKSLLGYGPQGQKELDTTEATQYACMHATYIYNIYVQMLGNNSIYIHISKKEKYIKCMCIYTCMYIYIYVCLYIYSYIYIYIIFQILFHYRLLKILSIVPYTIQQVSVVYLFYIQRWVSVNPKLLIHPSPSFPL